MRIWPILMYLSPVEHLTYFSQRHLPPRHTWMVSLLEYFNTVYPPFLRLITSLLRPRGSEAQSVSRLTLSASTEPISQPVDNFSRYSLGHLLLLQFVPDAEPNGQAAYSTLLPAGCRLFPGGVCAVHGTIRTSLAGLPVPSPASCHSGSLAAMPYL